MKITSNHQNIFSVPSDGLATLSVPRIGIRVAKQPLILPLILLLSFLTLQAQIPRDSLEAMTRRAWTHYYNDENAEAIALAQTIATGCRSLGDIPSACQAMELQALSSSDDPEQALAILDSAIAIYRSGCGDTSRTYFRLWKNKARMELEWGQFEAAHQTQLQADGLIPQCLAEGTANAFNEVLLYYYETAAFKNDLGLLQEAMTGLQAAIAFGQTQPQWANSRYMAGNYSDLSQTYRKLGDFPKAEEYNRMAAATIAQDTLDNALARGSWLQYTQDFAAILIEAQRYAEAKVILDAMLQTYLRQMLPPHGKIGSCHALLGTLHARIDSLDLAWKHTQLARAAFAQLGPAAAIYVAKMDINLAGIARKQRRFTLAAQLAMQAIQALQAHGIHNGAELSKAWQEAANAALALAQPLAAIHHIRQALAATVPASATDPLTVHPNAIFSPREHLQALHILGQIHEQQFAHDQDASSLRQATQAYEKAVDLMVYMDGSRIHLSPTYFTWERLWQDNYGIVEAAIRCNMALYSRTGRQTYAEKALAIADLSKASRITQNHMLFADPVTHLVPDQVHAAEKSILMTLASLRKQIQSTRDATELQAYLTQLNQAESKFAQGRKWLRKHAPRYYALRYEGASRTIAQPLHRPAPCQAFLEYFIGNDTIYAFLQTRNTMQAALIPKRAGIEADAAQFVDCILAGGTETEIAQRGAALFQQLLPFQPPTEEVRSLLIVPDGFLHQLPFCALTVPIQGQPQYNEGVPAYLVRHVDLIHDFSIHAHAQATQTLTVRPALEAIYGLFPMARYSYCDRLSGQVMTFSPPYPSALMRLFRNTGLLQDSLAHPPTRKTLLAALQRPSLIVLKTHGLYQDHPDGPKASFLLENDQGQADCLDLQALYGLPTLQTRMLILNACDIAQGPHHPGEGPLSIARALRQAGCPALLTNRWQADDQLNEHLLQRCCEALLEGYSADHALRVAQCGALTGDVRARQPMYWAGIVTYGGRGGM